MDEMKYQLEQGANTYTPMTNITRDFDSCPDRGFETPTNIPAECVDLEIDLSNKTLDFGLELHNFIRFLESGDYEVDTTEGSDCQDGPQVLA